jgi:pantothenate kinase-related protein Tda10
VTSAAQSWQEKLDRDFPWGVLVVWDRDEDSSVYPSAKPEVVSVSGLVPTVAMDVFETTKSLTFEVVTYEQVQGDPLVVRVKGRSGSRTSLWSSNLSTELAALMRGEL